jgi:hypothetical protein
MAVTYRAQAFGSDGLLRRYTLCATAYQDLRAKSPFEHSIVPLELTIRTESVLVLHNRNLRRSLKR